MFPGNLNLVRVQEDVQQVVIIAGFKSYRGETAVGEHIETSVRQLHPQRLRLKIPVPARMFPAVHVLTELHNRTLIPWVCSRPRRRSLV